MKGKKNKKMTALEKLLKQKKALSECIRKKGDVKKVADDEQIKLATPL